MKTLLAIKKSVLALSMLVFAFTVSAEDSPAKLVQDTSENVRSILLKENGSNTDAVRAEVQQVIYPRFDFNRMTALAVGKHWKENFPVLGRAFQNAAP